MTWAPDILGGLAPWPFDRTYMQLALASGLAVGISAPLVGAFLIQRRLALLGEGVGHLAFTGVAIGLAVGVSPLWSALIVASLGALAIEWLRRRRTMAGDVALALVLYGGLALGVVIISRASSANVTPYLFGSLLTVESSDVWIVCGIALLVIGVIALTERALLAVAIDEEVARLAGLPVNFLNGVVAVLTALIVVSAMRVVGVLLVAALIVLPVSTGQSLARSFRGTLVVGCLVGVASVVLGLTCARAFNLAPGGSVVLVAAGIFAIASLVGRTPTGLSNG